MARAYNVVDADGHILEPLDLWSRYMDPAFRDRAPRIVKDSETGKERLVIEEHKTDARINIGRTGAVGARQGVVEPDAMAYKDGKPGGFDPNARIPDMDADGIDAAFLYPSLGLFSGAIHDRSSLPRYAAPTSGGLPITAALTQTGCSASRCCRCRMSILQLPKCASRARSLASRRPS